MSSGQFDLIYLHIPKTAGTSQHGAFNAMYGKSNVFWIGDDCPGSIKRFSDLPATEARVIGGHKPLRFYPQTTDALFLSVVRDPLDRALSLFSFYSRPDLAVAPGQRAEREKHLRRLQDKGLRPDDLLYSLRHCEEFFQQLRNSQCKYLSRFQPSFDGVLRSLEGIDAVVGTLDTYENFFNYTNRLLGIPQSNMPVINNTRKGYRKELPVTEECVDEIRRLGVEDYKLYDYVSRREQSIYRGIRKPLQRVRRLRRLANQKPIAKPSPWKATSNRNIDWRLRWVVTFKDRHRALVLLPGARAVALLESLRSALDISQPDFLPKEGLLQFLAGHQTGAMLKDMSPVERDALLSDERTLAVTLVQHPVARAFESFKTLLVDHPERLRGQRQFLAGIARLQDTAVADLDRGVSFRDYVRGLVETPDEALGAARAPLTSFLEPFGGRVIGYTIGGLEGLLREFTDDPLVLGNALKWQAELAEFSEESVKSTARHADTPSGNLRGTETLELPDVVDAGLAQAISARYSGDLELWRTAHSMDRATSRILHG